MIRPHPRGPLAPAGRSGPPKPSAGVLAGLTAPMLAAATRPLLGFAVLAPTLGAVLKGDPASRRPIGAPVPRRDRADTGAGSGPRSRTPTSAAGWAAPRRSARPRAGLAPCPETPRRRVIAHGAAPTARRIFAVLAIALLCAAPPWATPGAALAQTAAPLRIGVLNDMSGIYADIAGPGSVTAARMAAEDFGGTVLGRPIEVLAGDHQNKPDIGAAIAKRWYERDGVGLIVDVPTSSVVLAVNEVARAGHRLLVVTTGGTSALTGRYCAPETFHWVYDTYGLAVGTATALADRGEKVWAFLTADYEFGKALEQDATAALERAGGRVVASIRHPQGTTDYASYLVRLQESGAQVIGLANAGSDTVNAIKQAQEFGLTRGDKQRLAGLFLNLADVHALGLAAAHGLLMTQGFYWDLDEGTRAFARRYFARQRAMPGQGQAGVYSAVRHYLQAVRAAGTDDPVAVAAAMRAAPVDDFFARGARIRADGKLAHELYLLRVKEPAEQRDAWDYLALVSTIPPEIASRPLAEGGCPLVK